MADSHSGTCRGNRETEPECSSACIESLTSWREMEAYLRACSLVSARVVPVPVGDRDIQVRYGVTLRCRWARVMYSIWVRIPKRELPLGLLLVCMATVTALTANLKAT